MSPWWLFFQITSRRARLDIVRCEKSSMAAPSSSPTMELTAARKRGAPRRVQALRQDVQHIYPTPLPPPAIGGTELLAFFEKRMSEERQAVQERLSEERQAMQERMSELFVRKNVKSKEVTVRWDHGPLHLTGESPLIRSLRARAGLSRCAPCPRREAGDLRRLCARDGHQRVRQIGFGVDAVLAA